MNRMHAVACLAAAAAVAVVVVELLVATPEKEHGTAL